MWVCDVDQPTRDDLQGQIAILADEPHSGPSNDTISKINRSKMEEN